MKKIIFILTFLLAVSSAAFAGDICKDRIYDESRIFSRQDSLRIMTAITDFQAATKAEAHVIMVPSAGRHGNLDVYTERLRDDCMAWQDGRDDWKGNIVVIMGATNEEDREAVIRVGNAWRTKMGKDYEDVVLDEKLIPGVLKGSWAEGVIESLKELERVMTLPDPSARSTQPVHVDRAPTPEETQAKFGFLKYLLLFFVLIVAVVVWLYLRKKRREEAERARIAEEKRKACQLVAQTEVSKVSSLSLSLKNDTDDLEAQLTNEVLDKVCETEGTALKELLENARQKRQEAATALGRLEQTRFNPSLDTLTTSEYEKITAAYAAIMTTLQKGEQFMNQLRRAIESTLKRIETVPALITSTSSRIDILQGNLNAIIDRGFKTEAQTDLIANARTTLELAKTRMSEKMYEVAQNLCAKADQQANAAVTQAQALESKRAQAAEELAALKKRLEGFPSKIQNALNAFEEIEDNFIPSASESVDGNGSEALNRVNEGNEVALRVEELSSMEQQKWDEALKLLEKAGGWLDEADDMLSDIHELLHHLQRCKESAPLEIQAAKADLAKAIRYEHTNDADIPDDAKNRLSNVQLILDRADQALQRQDYIGAVKLAKEAKAAAATVLSYCETENEKTDRLRQNVATEKAEAERSYNIAMRYTRSHNSDVESDAKALLRQAKSAYILAGTTRNLEEQFKYYSQADDLADKAYKKAKADVAKAEAARQPVYNDDDDDDDFNFGSFNRTTYGSPHRTTYRSNPIKIGGGGFAGGHSRSISSGRAGGHSRKF